MWSSIFDFKTFFFSCLLSGGRAPDFAISELFGRQFSPFLLGKNIGFCSVFVNCLGLTSLHENVKNLANSSVFGGHVVENVANCSVF